MAENINTYTGNAALGQGTAGGQGEYGAAPLTVTNDAVDKIMMYQFYENRDKWARQNMVADQQAKDAIAMNKFDISEWLPDDATAVQQELSKYYSFYQKNPSAVSLNMDPRTGKITNARENAELSRLNNNVNVLIQRAKGRKSKYDTSLTAVEGLQSPAKRAAGMAHMENQAKTSIWDDIIAYPNTTVYDGGKIKPKQSTPEKQTPGPEGYVTETKVSFPLMQQSIAAWMGEYENDQDLNNFVNSATKQATDAVAQVLAKNPNADDATIIGELAKLPNGQHVADMYKSYYNVKKFADEQSAKNAEVNAGTAPEIDLRNFAQADMMALILGSNSESDYKQTLTTSQIDVEKVQQAGANKRQSMSEGAAMARQVQQQKYETAKADENEASLGNARLAQVDYLANYPSYADPVEPPKTADLQAYGVKNIPSGTWYQLDTRQTNMQNIFRANLPGKIKSTEVPAEGAPEGSLPTNVTTDQYTIDDSYVVKDASGDIDKNKYVIMYSGPDGKKSSVLTAAQMEQATANLFNDGSSKSLDLVSKTEIGYRKLLKSKKITENAPAVSRIIGKTKLEQQQQAKAPPVVGKDGVTNIKMKGPGDIIVSYDGGKSYYKW